jgi:hypothetical protein
VVHDPFPGFLELALMYGRPFHHEAERTRWKLSPQKGEVSDRDAGLGAGVPCVKVGGLMISPIEVDRDAEELAYLGQSRLPSLNPTGERYGSWRPLRKEARRGMPVRRTTSTYLRQLSAAVKGARVCMFVCMLRSPNLGDGPKNHPRDPGMKARFALEVQGNRPNDAALLTRRLKVRALPP